MQDTPRFGRSLAVAALAIVICSIGWVARTTWHKLTAKEAPPVAQDPPAPGALQEDRIVPSVGKSTTTVQGELSPPGPPPVESRRGTIPTDNAPRWPRRILTSRRLRRPRTSVPRRLLRNRRPTTLKRRPSPSLKKTRSWPSHTSRR